MSSSTSFLSVEHIQQLKTICIGFLTERHQIKLPKAQIERVVEEVVNVFSRNVQDVANTDISAWNKQVILAVRDKCMLVSKPPIASTPTPTPIPSQTSIPAPANGNATIYDVPTATKGEDVENEFFKKLQSLELARKAPVVAAPPPQVPKQTPTQVPTPQPTQPQQPITVIVPSAAVGSPSVVTRIHSRQRTWMYQENVNGLVWNGPLPKQMDETNFKVVCLQLPSHCTTLTPYVTLRIEGAGGQKQDVYLIPQASSMVGFNGPSWVTYVPCSTSMAYVKRFALPWTLRILDTADQELMVGMDGWLIEQMDMQQNVLTLTHALLGDVQDAMTAGEILLIQDALERSYKACIRRVLSSTQVEIRWLGNAPNVSVLQAPIMCMNESRQWSVIMESHETSHTTKK